MSDVSCQRRNAQAAAASNSLSSTCRHCLAVAERASLGARVAGPDFRGLFSVGEAYLISVRVVLL